MRRRSRGAGPSPRGIDPEFGGVRPGRTAPRISAFNAPYYGTIFAFNS
jgi:hypothetical protein